MVRALAGQCVLWRDAVDVTPNFGLHIIVTEAGSLWG